MVHLLLRLGCRRRKRKLRGVYQPDFRFIAAGPQPQHIHVWAQSRHCFSRERTFVEGCVQGIAVTDAGKIERKDEMGEAEQEGLQCIGLPKAQPPHEIGQHHPTENGFLHERVAELPAEKEQGEEDPTQRSAILNNNRKDKSRALASDTEPIELDPVEDHIQEYQAEHPNE